MIRGSCLCNAVVFELAGELTPIQLCHATRCRKATGAAAAPELLVEAAGLRWIQGEERVRVYEAPLLEAPPAYRRRATSASATSLVWLQSRMRPVLRTAR